MHKTKTIHGQITIGVNAVDPYPLGEDAPQGDYFDEFFNVNWIIGIFYLQYLQFLFQDI